MNDERSTDDTQPADGHARLRRKFRELIKAYADARVTGRVPLSYWPAVDNAEMALGTRLGYTHEEITYMLISTVVSVPLGDLLTSIETPRHDRRAAHRSQVHVHCPRGRTVARVWQRRVRALDRESGKVMTDADGQILWHMVYDYMVEFDNGERANNLEAWELMPAVRTGDDEGDEGVSLTGLAMGRPTTWNAPTSQPGSTVLADNGTAGSPRPSLQDRITSVASDVRRRVRERADARGRRR